MNASTAIRHRREMLRIALERGDKSYLLERAQKLAELDQRSVLATGLIRELTKEVTAK